MTITVAMALSGLEPEQWNDGLKEIYMQGAILFPKSPSSLSLASSGGSSYYSLESGISSMSPDSAASYNPFHLNDLDNLGLDGMVKIQEPTQPTAANTLIDKTTLCEKMSKLDIFDKNKTATVVHQQEGAIALEPPPRATSEAPRGKPNKVYDKVMYGNRDVLNLFGNIAPSGWNFQPAVLPNTISNAYFENRSQYSRLQDAYPPKHTKEVCKDKDCGFVEYRYF